MTKHVYPDLRRTSCVDVDCGRLINVRRLVRQARAEGLLDEST